jgi:hypothetical protein
VRAGSAVNVCKTCGHVTIVRLQYNASTVDHSPDIATVLGDLTARRHAANRVRRGRMTRPDVPMPLKASFATSSQ